ncbi:glycosyltransferase family 4 protein [Vampirovibrio chlorellavorus]|uniref:glycosyltransferase family 4 protein n=1 Tax=Vampirovibrio chlorellavorus TaxID=758823 RepID=UPI0026F0112D|nr:glycosyltransferase family 4 protein [Vampirovibrio chlorellavorus]
MKKVCVLLNKDLSHQTRLFRENETLVKAGYDVSVVCVSEIPGKPKQEKQNGYAVCRLLKKRLYKYHLVSLRLLKSFLKVLTSHPRADYVHVHDPPVLLLGFLLAKFWKARLVYDSHEWWDALFQEEQDRLNNGTNMTPAQRRKKLGQLSWMRRFESWVLPHCDAVIAVNDSIGQHMQAQAPKPLKYYATIRNFSPYQQIERSNRLHDHFNLPAPTKVILYQGQIARKRGIDKAVEAIEHLADVDVVLVLIGPVLPADEQFLQTLLTRIEASETLRDRVFYKGFIPSSELLQWTASADLGLQPIINTCMNHYLCLPNKIFEYIQANIPIAASEFPELRNIVENYKIGFVFDPENPRQIAQKIRQFFDSPELKQAYLSNLQRAKQELCWETEEQKLLDLYAAIG